MKTMKRFQATAFTMILGGALAAFGCSAAPGTTGGTGTGGGNAGSSGTAPSADGGVSNPPLVPPSGPTSPNATPKDFCAGLDAWLTKCGSAPASGSEATCEQSYQKYTSAQIAASEACLAKVTCDNNALSQCLQEAVNPNLTPTADAGTGDTCQQCVDTQCSAQLNGCQANPDCVALYQCMQNAKTQADAQACENQSPNGVNDLQTLLTCVSGPCGTPCK